MTNANLEQEVLLYFTKHLGLPEGVSLEDPLSQHLSCDSDPFRFGIALMNFFEWKSIPIVYEQQSEFSSFPSLGSVVRYIESAR
jgi:hypothetical protein